MTERELPPREPMIPNRERLGIPEGPSQVALAIAGRGVTEAAHVLNRKQRLLGLEPVGSRPVLDQILLYTTAKAADRYLPKPGHDGLDVESLNFKTFNNERIRLVNDKAFLVEYCVKPFDKNDSDAFEIADKIQKPITEYFVVSGNLRLPIGEITELIKMYPTAKAMAEEKHGKQVAEPDVISTEVASIYSTDGSEPDVFNYDELQRRYYKSPEGLAKEGLKRIDEISGRTIALLQSAENPVDPLSFVENEETAALERAVRGRILADRIDRLWWGGTLMLEPDINAELTKPINPYNL